MKGSLFIAGEYVGEVEMGPIPNVGSMGHRDDPHRFRSATSCTVTVEGTARWEDPGQELLFKLRMEKFRAIVDEIAAGPILPIYPQLVYKGAPEQLPPIKLTR